MAHTKIPSISRNTFSNPSTPQAQRQHTPSATSASRLPRFTPTVKRASESPLTPGWGLSISKRPYSANAKSSSRYHQRNSSSLSDQHKPLSATPKYAIHARPMAENQNPNQTSPRTSRVTDWPTHTIHCETTMTTLVSHFSSSTVSANTLSDVPHQQDLDDSPDRLAMNSRTENPDASSTGIPGMAHPDGSFLDLAGVSPNALESDHTTKQSTDHSNKLTGGPEAGHSTASIPGRSTPSTIAHPTTSTTSQSTTLVTERPHSPNPVSFSQPRPKQHIRDMQMKASARAHSNASKIPLIEPRNTPNLVNVRKASLVHDVSAKSTKSPSVPTFGLRRLDTPEDLAALMQESPQQRKQVEQPTGEQNGKVVSGAASTDAKIKTFTDGEGKSVESEAFTGVNEVSASEKQGPLDELTARTEREYAGRDQEILTDAALHRIHLSSAKVASQRRQNYRLPRLTMPDLGIPLVDAVKQQGFPDSTSYDTLEAHFPVSTNSSVVDVVKKGKDYEQALALLEGREDPPPVHDMPKRLTFRTARRGHMSMTIPPIERKEGMDRLGNSTKKVPSVPESAATPASSMDKSVTKKESAQSFAQPTLSSQKRFNIGSVKRSGPENISSQRPATNSIGYPSRVPSKASAIIGPSEPGICKPLTGTGRRPGAFNAKLGGSSITPSGASSTRTVRHNFASVNDPERPSSKLTFEPGLDAERSLPQARKRSKSVIKNIKGLFTSKKDESAKTDGVGPLPSLPSGLTARTNKATSSGSPITQGPPRVMTIGDNDDSESEPDTTQGASAGSETATFRSADESFTGGHNTMATTTNTTAQASTTYDISNLPHETQGLPPAVSRILSDAHKETDPAIKARMISMASLLLDGITYCRQSQKSMYEAQQAAAAAKASYEMTVRGVVEMRRLAEAKTAAHAMPGFLRRLGRTTR